MSVGRERGSGTQHIYVAITTQVDSPRRELCGWLDLIVGEGAIDPLRLEVGSGIAK